MKTKQVTAVVVGADRIAVNGDTANKIGTYQVAYQSRVYLKSWILQIELRTITIKDVNCSDNNGLSSKISLYTYSTYTPLHNYLYWLQIAILAKYHNIPFYVAAPLTSVDFQMLNGDQIVIEERSEREMTHINDKRIAAEGITCWNPAFDVTPASLITGIVTEIGIFKPSELINAKEDRKRMHSWNIFSEKKFHRHIYSRLYVCIHRDCKRQDTLINLIFWEQCHKKISIWYESSGKSILLTV